MLKTFVLCLALVATVVKARYVLRAYTTRHGVYSSGMHDIKQDEPVASMFEVEDHRILNAPCNPSCIFPWSRTCYEDQNIQKDLEEKKSE